MKAGFAGILVKLSISMWDGKKSDKKATAVVAKSFNSQQGFGDFIKNLFPGPSRLYLDKVQQVATQIRAFHYRETAPWYEGVQVLKASAYTNYDLEMSRLIKGVWVEAVRAFEENYDQMVEEAKTYLGGLFNQTDYPKLEDLKRKFEIRHQYFELRETEDFRLHLSPEAEERLKSEFEKSFNSQLGEALTAVYKRIDAALQQAMKNLTVLPGSGRFRKEWHSNLKDLVDSMGSLNLTDDPKLTELGDQIKKFLEDYPLEDVEEVLPARQEAQRKVQGIMDAFKSIGEGR